MENGSQTTKSPRVERIRATRCEKCENRRENKTNQSQSVAVWLLLAAPWVMQMRDGSQPRPMAVSTVYLQWICPDRQRLGKWLQGKHTSRSSNQQESVEMHKKQNPQSKKKQKLKTQDLSFYRVLDQGVQSLHSAVHQVQKVNEQQQIVCLSDSPH